MEYVYVLIARDRTGVAEYPKAASPDLDRLKEDAVGLLPAAIRGAVEWQSSKDLSFWRLAWIDVAAVLPPLPFIRRLPLIPQPAKA